MKVRQTSPRYPSLEQVKAVCEAESAEDVREFYNAIVAEINAGRVMWDGEKLYLVQHEA